MGGNIKGSSFTRTQEYFERIGGKEGAEKVLQSLSEEDRQVIKTAWLPSSKYSFDTLMRWRIAGDKILGKGDLALVRNITEYAADKEFKGIYKLFISLASSKFVIERAPLLWGMYMDKGKCSTKLLGDKKFDVIVEEYPDPPLHHDIIFATYVLKGIEISGGKNPRQKHSTCVLRGDSFCTYSAEWE